MDPDIRFHLLAGTVFVQRDGTGRWRACPAAQATEHTGRSLLGIDTAAAGGHL
ncbi:hypothetical protein [Kitasatospora sp. NPDC088346]|uniref:hypothetical protein n=1 Tax=Kitasatospora sp. NPDC088346 TaxID=3364073 RepID=UPI00382E0E2B